jgi:hypothetical protein
MAIAQDAVANQEPVNDKINRAISRPFGEDGLTAAKLANLPADFAYHR